MREPLPPVAVEAESGILCWYALMSTQCLTPPVAWNADGGA